MNLPIMAFDDGYAQLFGDDHLVVLKDGKTIHFSLPPSSPTLIFPSDEPDALFHAVR
jgi:hypothetical protein